MHVIWLNFCPQKIAKIYTCTFCILHTHTVKPVHAVTPIKQSPVLESHIFLPYHKPKKYMNGPSFKGSSVL